MYMLINYCPYWQNKAGDKYFHNRDFSESTDQRGRERKIRGRTLKKIKNFPTVLPTI